MEEELWIECESLEVPSDPISGSEQHEEEEPDVGDLFADPDPYDTFHFDFDLMALPAVATEKSSIGDDDDDDDDHQEKKGNNNNKIHITLGGHKMENGQNLKSTGLTLWRAAPLLCEYMIQRQHDDIQDKNVLELGAGLGLCGILAHKLGARHVVLTDGDSATLHEMRQNVSRNNSCSSSEHQNDTNKIEDNDNSSSGTTPRENRIHCHQLRWGHRLQEFQDTIVTSILTPNDKDPKDAIRNDFDVNDKSDTNDNNSFDLIIASDIIYVEEIIDPLLDTIVTLLTKQPHGMFWLSYARRNVDLDLVFAAAQARKLSWRRASFATGNTSEGVYIFEWANTKTIEARRS